MLATGVGMLVVTANWGIGDGTVANGAAATRAQSFAAALRRAAARAGCRADGRYRPPERVDVVFAGDTFDWLVSTRWAGRDRPWHAGRRSAAVRRDIVRASLAHAWATLHPVLALVRRGLGLPAADRRGRPAWTRSVTVPVGVVLLTGDRDARLETVGAGRLAHRLGVRIGSGAAWGQVVIHHGHEAGPPDHRRGSTAADTSTPTLRESVLVDLLVPFAIDCSAAAPPGLLRRLAAAPSPLDMPHVIAAAARHGDADMPRDAGAALVDGWRRAVERWHRAARRSVTRHGAPFDPFDALADWLSATDAPPDRSPPPFLAAITALPDPRVFAGAAPVAILGHAPGTATADGGCVGLGPRPPSVAACAGAATTVGGPGSVWVVPAAESVDPVRAVVVADPAAIRSWSPLPGFAEALPAMATAHAGWRSVDAA